MAVHLVRLGTPRAPGEGPRLGTVRRPPRGVPRAEFATRDFYDTWLPVLAPSAELVAEGRQAADARAFAHFARRYRREMAEPAPRQVIALLAVLSQHADFAVGCYCEDATRCHRSVLGELLAEAGARVHAA